MNFLELCRAVGRESRTIDGNLPATVANQTGRLGKIVQWTAQAYRDIQNHRTDWLWMERDFSGNLIAGQSRIDEADLNLARVGQWRIGKDTQTGKERLLVTNSAGLLQPVVGCDWPLFRDKFVRSSEAARLGVPRRCSIDPEGYLRLWPKPDQAYNLNGLYRLKPQVLHADADVPEMPEEHHSIIVWKALVLLATHDEAFAQGGAWNGNWLTGLSELSLNQLPPIGFA